uniref:SET domain-containing protein n=1 Tax=Lotharella oceanica TaxID=641309 RepID=A0A7S2TVR9_9EUKA|mmetsp:Transcript_32113/g.59793  ORF Transcript_32113/g.59793 Transcript_32113/m.59793 type:complete len:363 (+) Transcript_32113:122-1210(+)
MLFYLITMANHACSPNLGGPAPTRSMSSPLEHFLVSERQIEPGEMLTTSYINFAGLLMPTKDRRLRLFTGKRFWCDCVRCLADDLLRPFSCPKCPKGVMYHSVGRENNGTAGWKCAGACAYSCTHREAEMSILRTQIEDEEAVAQDVVFPTANIEDDGQRGQIFDVEKAKEGLSRIASCVRPDHAYRQLYLNLVGKALIARGVSGWDVDENDGSLDRAKRDESMNLGFDYLTQHYLWLKKLPEGTLPRRLIDEVSHDWVLEAYRRVDEGQLEGYILPKSLREAIMKVKGIVEGKTIEQDDEAARAAHENKTEEEQETKGAPAGVHFQPRQHEEEVAGGAFDRMSKLLEQWFGCSCFGSRRRT